MYNHWSAQETTGDEIRPHKVLPTRTSRLCQGCSTKPKALFGELHLSVTSCWSVEILAVSLMCPWSVEILTVSLKCPRGDECVGTGRLATTTSVESYYITVEYLYPYVLQVRHICGPCKRQPGVEKEAQWVSGLRVIRLL